MKSCVYCKARYEKGSQWCHFSQVALRLHSQTLFKKYEGINWTPTMYHYLCSKHFTEACFLKHQSRTTLKKCSIPIIFLETNSSLLQTEMSKDADQRTGYQCWKDIEMNLDKFNSPLVPVQVGSPNYDYKYIEVNPKEMLPCEALAVTSTSYNISYCSTPKTSRTLAEILSSVKLDHHYENTPKSSKIKLERVKRALKMSQARIKVLSQNVKHMKINVSTLRSVIADLKKKETGI